MLVCCDFINPEPSQIESCTVIRLVSVMTFTCTEKILSSRVGLGVKAELICCSHKPPHVWESKMSHLFVNMMPESFQRTRFSHWDRFCNVCQTLNISSLILPHILPIKTAPHPPQTSLCLSEVDWAIPKIQSSITTQWRRRGGREERGRKAAFEVAL